MSEPLKPWWCGKCATQLRDRDIEQTLVPVHAFCGKPVALMPGEPDRRSATSESVRAVDHIMLRLDADPHQWSKRPCATCSSITKAIGRDFGCVRYAKSSLSFGEYAGAAFNAIAALSQEGE